jgi:hypothetical protein
MTVTTVYKDGTSRSVGGERAASQPVQQLAAEGDGV